MMNLSDFINFISQAYFSGKPKWSQDNIPDLNGKVVIVTGGSAGLGKETVKALLEHNATVYLAARNRVKAEEVIEELANITGQRAVFLSVDLGDLTSVKKAAEEFQSKETELHILYNNAGVFVPPVEEITTQGYDMQFGTNLLGHFYLTQLLLPSLLSTAKSADGGTVRVITSTSSGHYTCSSSNPLVFDTFKDGPTRRKRTSEWLYYQSNFARIVFSNELARRYGEKGIVSTAVNPGNIKSDISRTLSRWSSLGITVYLLQIYNIDWGVLTQLWAGTSPEGAELGGKYLRPWCRVGTAKEGTNDSSLGKELWLWMEDQVKDI